jgi:hypothetical protein
MAKPNLHNINPREIFLHGNGFHRTVQLVGAMNFSPQDGMEIASPMMVLSALNSELFFKCLICIETGQIPIGHNLADLFQMLSETTRQRIDHIWQTEAVPLREKMWLAIEKQIGEPIKRDLLSALVAGSRAFELIRYSYERGEPITFYLNDLPTILGRVILEIKPDWNNLHHQVTRLLPSPQ